MNTIPVRKRRWFQYSLRMLFLLTTLLAVWLGLWVDGARRQARAIQAIRAVGGRIDTDAIGPQWLSEWFDGRYCVRVTSVSLDSTQATDANLEHLKDMPHLMLLSLGGTAQSNLTIRGNQVVEGTSPLTDKGSNISKGSLSWRLFASGAAPTSPTRAWRICKNSKASLGSVLGYTPITDEGINYLCRMSHLEKLDLTGTRVTIAGVAKLQRACPSWRLCVSRAVFASASLPPALTHALAAQCLTMRRRSQRSRHLDRLIVFGELECQPVVVDADAEPRRTVGKAQQCAERLLAQVVKVALEP